MARVAWAAGLSVLAAAIVGIVPALKATGRNVKTGLRLGKMWTALIVAQVGLAVAILPSAVFSVWESMKNGTADPGFAADQFLSAQITSDNGPGRAMELIRQLQAEPGVASVTFSMASPGDEPGARMEAQGGQATGHEVRFNYVDIHFFRNFEVPLLAGRGLGSADVAPGHPKGGNAVLVNQSFALRVFGGDALGRRVRYQTAERGEEEKGRWYEIVGIVSDFPKGASPGIADSQMKVYHAASAGQVQPESYSIRIRGPAPSTFAGRLRDVAAAVDPELQLRNVLSLEEVLRREQWIRILEGSVFGMLTVSVLLLSAAGIYALMSLTVSQRRKEIGIRVALGADRWRIVSGIFARALGQLAVGAIVGVGLAVALERALWGDLMKEKAPVVLPVVALIVVAVGFMGTFGPARRSLRIEPTEALREQ